MTKRQKIPHFRTGLPGLWVVTTPIGNLGDLSPRAREVLQGADRILCEDTRRTRQLLSALEMTTPTERCDVHRAREQRQVEKWLDELRSGQRFALVTDAGVPGVSDPGAVLVDAAHEAGIPVTPIPGPSAVTTLLSIAGINETAFTFRGYFPRGERDQRQELEAVRKSTVSRVFLWFESPQRIVDSLQFIAQTLMPEDSNHPSLVFAAKELTKVFERSFRGNSQHVFEQVQTEVQNEGAVGEWCFAIQFSAISSETGDSSSLSQSSLPWFNTLECLAEFQVPLSAAVRKVSQSFGIPKNVVYDKALEIFKKK